MSTLLLGGTERGRKLRSVRFTMSGTKAGPERDSNSTAVSISTGGQRVYSTVSSSSSLRQDEAREHIDVLGQAWTVAVRT
jgi:hypothetical protein